MSRIGEKPVDIVAGVTATVEGARVLVKGAKGELTLDIPPELGVDVGDGKITVSRQDDNRQSRSLHGLLRSLIANMVEGVTSGFKKELVVEGVGYRSALEGGTLVLTLGFSRPIEYAVPDGVDIAVEGPTIAVTGVDKQKVGDAAAHIRSFSPSDPYKGKGIRYKDERVRRKVGKTVA